MAQNQTYDFALAASGQSPHGFMLARSGQMRGRAWKRSGVPISAGSPFPEEERFESQQVPSEVAFVDVFDDFSGGYGYAYKRPPLPYRYIPVIAREMADPNVYHYAENFDARFQNQLVHAQALLTASIAATLGDGVVRDVVQFLETQYFSAGGVVGIGTQVYALEASGGQAYAFTPALPASDASIFHVANAAGGQAGVTGRPAVFGSYYYIGTNGSFTQLNSPPNTAISASLSGQMFAVAGNRLWRAFGPNDSHRPTNVSSVAAGADPMVAANWAATIAVGDGITPINDIIAFDQKVYLGLPQGLFQGDSSGTFMNVTGDLGGQAHPDNFRDMCVHDGQVIGGHIGGVFAYDATNTSVPRVRQIGPIARSNRSPVQGFARTMRSYGGWLYAGLWTGSVSYILAGRDTKGAGPFEWHVMNRLPGQVRIGRMHFDGITTSSGGGRLLPTRLWVAGDPSINYGGLSLTAPLYVMPIPRLNGNPLAPDALFSANYNGSAQMYLPSTDRGAPGIQKVYERVEVWADALQATTRYLNVYMSIDRGTRTLVGSANTSPVTVIPLGSSNGYWPAGKSYELSFDSFTTTPGSCHVIRSINVYGKMRPRVVDTVTAVVKIADDMTDRQNTPMRPASVQIDDLRSYADPTRLGGVPIQLIDLAGATSWVLVQAPIQESETYEQGSQNPEIAATVQMIVMNLSAA